MKKILTYLKRIFTDKCVKCGSQNIDWRGVTSCPYCDLTLPFKRPENKKIMPLVIHDVRGTLPTPEQSKKAMLRRKVKFIDNMDKFSSRKNAYKQGWKDCYDWVMSQGNDR